MGLFSWLFGGSRAPKWRYSEVGNPTTVYLRRRVTVFESDGGWKYCISDKNDDTEPLFAGPYDSLEAAKYEALAYLDGRPSQNTSRGGGRREDRLRKGYADVLATQSDRLIELQNEAENPSAKLSDLRRVQTKIASSIRQLNSSKQLAADLDSAMASRLNALERKYADLSDQVSRRQDGLRQTRSKPLPDVEG